MWCEGVRDVHKDVVMDVLSQSEGRRWRYWAESRDAGGAVTAQVVGQRGLCGAAVGDSSFGWRHPRFMF